MTTVKRQFKELLSRCEAVGWKVRPAGNGHTLILAHNGQGESFPSTTRSQQGFRNALQWCKRNGLLDLEANLETKHKQDRQERLKKGQLVSMPSTVTNREYINGVKVSERAPAMVVTPLTKGRVVPTKVADELLLEDGTITYQCNHDECYKTFPSAISVRAHRSKAHPKPKPTAVPPIAKPSAAKKAKRHAPKLTPQPTMKTTKIQDTSSLESIVTRLEANLSALKQWIKDAPIATPEMVEKARKYDELKAQFG